MKTRTVPVLLALLLGIAPVTAEPDGAAGGLLDAERVEAVLPSLDGALALAFTAVPSGGGVPADFTLTAVRLELDVDRSDIAFGPANYAGESYALRSDHANATLRGVDNRPSGELYVLPVPGQAAPQVALETGCLDLAPSKDRDIARYDPYLNGSRGAAEVDLTGLLRLRACHAPSAVLVTGSFLVRLWNWDAVLQDDAGEQDLQTGYYEHPDSVPQRASEAYLTVHDGALRFPTTPESLRVYSDHTSVESDLVRFAGAAGFASPGDHDAEVDGDDLVYRGGVRFDAYVEEGRIVARILQPDAVQTDRGPLAVLASPTPGAPWALPVVALVLLAVGAVWLHRRRAPLRALDLFWTDHELDLSVAPRTPRERRALGMQLLGARCSMDGDVERGQRLQARAAELYDCPVEALLGLGETLLALGAYEHALDVLFVVQESEDATATQRVRAQLGAAAAHMRRNAPADQHVCVEYLRDADARDPSTVRRLLERAGGLGAELARRLPRSRSTPGEAMFG